MTALREVGFFEPPPSLRGRRFSLVPFTPEYYRPTYALAIEPEISFRWRYHGAIPPYETFQQTLFANVFQQFAVVADHDPMKFVGLVVAYKAELQDQHVAIAAMMSHAFGAGTFEAVALIGRHLFRNWPFRKLYLEIPEFNIPQLRSAVTAGLLREEGRLKAHRYYNEKYWDYVTYAIYREDAAAFGEQRPGILPDLGSGPSVLSTEPSADLDSGSANTADGSGDDL